MDPSHPSTPGIVLLSLALLTVGIVVTILDDPLPNTTYWTGFAAYVLVLVGLVLEFRDLRRSDSQD